LGSRLLNFCGSLRSHGRRGHLVRNFVFKSFIVLVIGQRYIDDRLAAVNNQGKSLVDVVSQVLVMLGRVIQVYLVNYNVLI